MEPCLELKVIAQETLVSEPQHTCRLAKGAINVTSRIYTSQFISSCSDSALDMSLAGYTCRGWLVEPQLAQNSRLGSFVSDFANLYLKFMIYSPRHVSYIDPGQATYSGYANNKGCRSIKLQTLTNYDSTLPVMGGLLPYEVLLQLNPNSGVRMVSVCI
jgi:hypothetical protein